MSWGNIIYFANHSSIHIFRRELPSLHFAYKTTAANFIHAQNRPRLTIHLTLAVVKQSKDNGLIISISQKNMREDRVRS